MMIRRFICRVIGHDYPKERPIWRDGNYVWQCRRCGRVVHGWIRSRWQ